MYEDEDALIEVIRQLCRDCRTDSTATFGPPRGNKPQSLTHKTTAVKLDLIEVIMSLIDELMYANYHLPFFIGCGHNFPG
jgi:hypothetical protein